MIEQWTVELVDVFFTMYELVKDFQVDPQFCERAVECYRDCYFHSYELSTEKKCVLVFDQIITTIYLKQVLTGFIHKKEHLNKHAWQAFEFLQDIYSNKEIVTVGSIEIQGKTRYLHGDYIPQINLYMSQLFGYHWRRIRLKRNVLLTEQNVGSNDSYHCDIYSLTST